MLAYVVSSRFAERFPESGDELIPSKSVLLRAFGLNNIGG